jgi:hypothetical protein
MSLNPNIRIAASSPPPCRGRVRVGVEALMHSYSTPISPFPLQGGRSEFDAEASK